MTKTDKRVEAVAALIADRRKYEGWLAALEAKRAETPDHVFFRVRSDYERRLSEVLERLRSQASALSERADALTARLATLVDDERANRDRRAEAELRVSVGELSQTAWDALLKETADAVARIEAERKTVQSELVEIRQLLGGGADPAKTSNARAATSGKAAESKGAPSAAVESTEAPELPPDELAFLRSLIAQGSTPAAGSPAAPASTAPPAPPPVASAPPPPPLNVQPSVIVNESAALIDPNAQRNTPPLAMNVPENEDVVIRGEDAEAKTLRCAECGALNVATEWYCEQCGSELATG